MLEAKKKNTNSNRRKKEHKNVFQLVSGTLGRK